MFELENIKNYLSKELENNFKLNKEKLIESFIEYFGEKYRQIITYKINKMCFICYISDKEIQNIYKQENVSNSIIFNYVNLFKQISNKTNSVLSNQRIIYCSIKSLNNENLSNDLMKLFLRQRNNTELIYRINNEYLNLIIFSPLVNDNVIIHEMVHALKDEILLEIYNSNNKIYCGQTGICTYLKDDKLIKSPSKNLNEVLTQIITDKIEKNFHLKNGNLINNTSLYKNTNSLYSNNNHLLIDFYLLFEEELKEIIINGNINLLVNLCGKNNYQEYLKLFNYYYSEIKRNKRSEIIERQVINSIVDKIKEYKSNQIRMNKNDIANYYYSLIKKGYKIKIFQK